MLHLCHSEEDHVEPDEEEDEGEGEEESSLLQEEEEAESMELDQAPAAIPVPAPDEPPVKRKRGRPPKNAPKPPTPSKSVRVAAKTTASGKTLTGFIRLERIMLQSTFMEKNSVHNWIVNKFVLEVQNMTRKVSVTKCMWFH